MTTVAMIKGNGRGTLLWDRQRGRSRRQQLWWQRWWRHENLQICRRPIEISQLKTMPQRTTTNISRFSKFPNKSSGSSEQMLVSECECLESLQSQMGFTCLIVGLFQFVGVVNHLTWHIIYLTYSIQRWPWRSKQLQHSTAVSLRVLKTENECFTFCSARCLQLAADNKLCTVISF